MITHAREELEHLSTLLTNWVDDPVAGWVVETWDVDEPTRAQAIAAYEAILLGGSSGAAQVLAEFDVDLTSLLVAPARSADKITRADVIELLAAAMLIRDGFSADELFLPNIPKMSRKKSDSGLDVTAIRLGAVADGSEDLLWIASVKHSINASSAADVRWKVADSLTRSSLSSAYLSVQFRVLNAKLREQGVAKDDAQRIYYFLRDDAPVRIIGVAAVASDLADDLAGQVEAITQAEWADAVFRKVGFPRLRQLADDCP